jgi:hypothetical protein
VEGVAGLGPVWMAADAEFTGMCGGGDYGSQRLTRTLPGQSSKHIPCEGQIQGKQLKDLSWTPEWTSVLRNLSDCDLLLETV